MSTGKYARMFAKTKAEAQERWSGYHEVVRVYVPRGRFPGLPAGDYWTLVSFAVEVGLRDSRTLKDYRR